MVKIDNIRQLLRHSVFRNSVSLYAAQIVSSALSLLAIRYLAQTLGADGWGAASVSLAFSAWLNIILEYGFNFSATRELVRAKDKSERDLIVANVFGAKLILTTVAAILTMIMIQFVPILKAHPDLASLAFLGAIFQGFIPVYYFQAQERPYVTALIDVGTRLFFLSSIHMFIHSTEDTWRVLALTAFTYALGLGIAYVLMYREIVWRSPSLGDVFTTLASSWSVFVYRAATSLYTILNPVLLSFFVSQSQIGYYTGADRIYGYVTASFLPLWRSMFPRMNVIALKTTESMQRAILKLLLIFGVIGIIASTILLLFSKLLVNIILGSEFNNSTGILQILALSVPFVAISGLLGFQWAIPMNLDRQFTNLTLFAGVFNIGFAMVVVPKFGGAGLAWSIFFTEMVLCACLYFLMSNYYNSLERKKDEG